VNHSYTQDSVHDAERCLSINYAAYGIITLVKWPHINVELSKQGIVTTTVSANVKKVAPNRERLVWWFTAVSLGMLVGGGKTWGKRREAIPTM